MNFYEFTIGLHIYFFREILTNVLRAMVNNSFKENFYGKRKKKINVLTVFSISHKIGIKIVCCRQATKNKIYTPKNICSGVSKDRSHKEYLA